MYKDRLKKLGIEAEVAPADPKFAMPTPPADIAKIIDKVDARLELTPKEEDQLSAWENRHGGFGGCL